jgi:dipeptidyl aminopeptidase/acylaminoacyl peptidase
MKRSVLFSISLLLFTAAVFAQQPLTPEKLWSVGRVSVAGITPDGKNVAFSVSTPDLAENKSARAHFTVPVAGGPASPVESAAALVRDRNLSPDGKWMLFTKSVKLKNVAGSDFHTDLPKSNVKIFDGLHYRHWDTWRDGTYSHLFLAPVVNGNADESQAKDLMEGEPFDCPQLPFGGDEDFTWSADGKAVVYVKKALNGTAYATSTNTDLYRYDLATGKTENLTAANKGYDTHPLYSSTGVLAYLQMERDGYEADKQDIIVWDGVQKMNLTAQWDGTVNGFIWSKDAKKLYFNAPVNGTVQIFEVDYPGKTKKMPVVRQITSGDFDVNTIVEESGKSLIVLRNDMNRASEIYSVTLDKGVFTKLSGVNDVFYKDVAVSRTERRMVKTTDGKDMLVWVIYPPGFDPSKKYPAMLFCQGGPQVALTQTYSYRWNFQLMAAQGYIVVAPNRRGMPGHGKAWNEQISGDWGGQVMQDYLSAIDNVSAEPFVDKARLAAVGASYGGYSVFYLAGIHNNRFKTFIAHAGVFNLKSMYGTTEEVFFTNWDNGGAYWDKENARAQKTYAEFDPSANVGKWNTPMLVIHGGKDFRVPESQGFEAYQALQLRGIKSKLVYFPEENHWILSAQNAIVWQREFFGWLKETL